MGDVETRLGRLLTHMYFYEYSDDDRTSDTSRDPGVLVAIEAHAGWFRVRLLDQPTFIRNLSGVALNHNFRYVSALEELAFVAT